MSINSFTGLFVGEHVLQCTICRGELRRIPGRYTPEHVGPSDGHYPIALHRCATCKGQPYYRADAWGDVVGCHACGTRSFYRLR